MHSGLPPHRLLIPLLILYAAASRKSDFLYFVSDAEGGHKFWRTLAEHNKNVRIYRQKMKVKKPNANSAKRAVEGQLYVVT